MEQCADIRIKRFTSVTEVTTKTCSIKVSCSAGTNQVAPRTWASHGAAERRRILTVFVCVCLHYCRSDFSHTCVGFWREIFFLN